MTKNFEYEYFRKNSNQLEIRGVQELTLSPLPGDTSEFSFVQRSTDNSSLQDENVMTALAGKGGEVLRIENSLFFSREIRGVNQSKKSSYIFPKKSH